MSEFEQYIRLVATYLKLNEDLAVRQAKAESGLNPTAVSPKGAFGLFQLMPATAAAYGIKTPAQKKDWKLNVDAGLRMMRDLLAHYKGTYDKALAAYNWGQGNLDKCIAAHETTWRQHLPEETFNYLNRILEDHVARS